MKKYKDREGEIFFLIEENIFIEDSRIHELFVLVKRDFDGAKLAIPASKFHGFEDENHKNKRYVEVAEEIKIPKIDWTSEALKRDPDILYVESPSVDTMCDNHREISEEIKEITKNAARGPLF